MDVNLEVMQDIPDESVPEDQVRELGDLFSVSPDTANSVLESNNSQENFSGFELGLDQTQPLPAVTPSSSQQEKLHKAHDSKLSDNGNTSKHSEKHS